jgi:hypothetical protein
LPLVHEVRPAHADDDQHRQKDQPLGSGLLLFADDEFALGAAGELGGEVAAGVATVAVAVVARAAIAAAARVLLI